MPRTVSIGCQDFGAIRREGYFEVVTTTSCKYEDAFGFTDFDAGNQPSEVTEPERFYHGFILGLMVDLMGRYHITFNRESGFGRYDVMLDPLKAGDPAFVLEFKVRDPEDEETLEDTVSAALWQIKEKAYDSELIVREISLECIRHYGFAFEGKTVLIG